MGRINQLTPTTTLRANSVIAMDAESGGATNKVTIQTLASGLRSFGNYATQTDLNRKQDVLTFDDSPEEDSDNPVTSGGIYNAIGSAMSNVYTKAETDNAIAQSTANIAIKRTVTASDFTQGNTKWVTLPVVSGYTPVGIVGLRSPQDAAGLTKLYYWDVSAPAGTYHVRFVANATFDKTIEADVLYIKN